MQSLKERLGAFQGSRVGLFGKKIMDDQAPNLAALLAWGTLSALLPLMLGILAVAGLLLRDPKRLDDVYNTLLVLVPAQAAGPVGDALTGVRMASAAPVGVLAILLLLYNGSSFFGNMASVFDQAYHVPSRNMVLQRLVAIGMLIITTGLLVVSSLAAGISSLIGNVPLDVTIGPALAHAVSWAITLVSVVVLFVLLYKVLPNAGQGWREVLPGALLSSVLFFVISLVFPLYVSLFPPNQAYAVFGVFLVFTFWLYLLGFVFVLGAELNAFMREPSRTTALAEATAAAKEGRASYEHRTGKVLAQAEGSAPVMDGVGTLGTPSRPAPAPAQQPVGQASPPSRTLAGRVLGFIGLLVAALVLRGQLSQPSHDRAHA